VIGVVDDHTRLAYCEIHSAQNGKIERFFQTLDTDWAHGRVWQSSTARSSRDTHGEALEVDGRGEHTVMAQG
jgi:hypothetical protein